MIAFLVIGVACVSLLESGVREAPRYLNRNAEWGVQVLDFGIRFGSVSGHPVPLLNETSGRAAARWLQELRVRAEAEKMIELWYGESDFSVWNAAVAGG